MIEIALGLVLAYIGVVVVLPLLGMLFIGAVAGVCWCITQVSNGIKWCAKIMHMG